MRLIWWLLNALELIYVVVGEILLEGTSDIIRFLVRISLPTAAACRNFNCSLIALTRYEHRVYVIIDVVIYGYSFLE